MVRRDVLAQLGGFDPMLKVGEDIYLWARLAVQHPRLVYVAGADCDILAGYPRLPDQTRGRGRDPGPARARA